jgi:hypothetical protein
VSPAGIGKQGYRPHRPVKVDQSHNSRVKTANAACLEKQSRKRAYDVISYTSDMVTHLFIFNRLAGWFNTCLLSVLTAAYTGIRNFINFTQFENIPRVEAGWNTPTVAQPVVGGDKREPRAWGYNRATLSLGNINMGTWHSRLGASRI